MKNLIYAKLFCSSFTYVAIMTCAIGTATCNDPAQCPEGTLFVQNTLVGTCTPCGPTTSLTEGYYCNSGVPTLCPAGYYCPYTSGAIPIICPEGSYCQEGFSEPVDCGRLFKCPEGSAARKPGLGAALIVVFVALALLACIFLLKFLTKRRLKKSAKAAQKHREVSRAYSDFVQTITGEPTGAGPMQGFNEKIKYLSPVSIQFDGLGMRLKSNGQLVLDGVTGEFPPGSLVALMGGSGAGKSTFMNALANRAPYGDVAGRVTINGVSGQTLAAFPRLVGFVPQDDIMHDDLTVYENLLYSAQLRLPPSMTNEQRRAIVEDVIEILDLARIRDVVVGSPEKRGISGGQKKRVNIGMELVAYPRVLFLDEPTSGLDSAASLQVARCLQRMRALGITVVTVIHQPRYSVFRCFSHCMLFAKGGRLVYLGPTGSIQRYFEELGFTLPAGENVADWFIDIVSGQSVRRVADSSGQLVVDKNFVPERDLPEIWLAKKNQFLASIPAQELLITTRADDGNAVPSSESLETDILNALVGFFNMPPDDVLTVCDFERVFTLNELQGENDTIEGLYKQIKDSVPGGGQLTTRALAKIIAKNEAEQLGIIVARRTSSTHVNASSGGRIENRKSIGFFSQLKAFVQRNAAKFDSKMLLIRCLVAVVGAVIVAVTFRGNEEYSMLPTIAQSGLILFAIISASSFLYVFGDERIVFRRESQTGYSLVAYWLAKNIVNLIDVAVIAVFYYAFYYIIVAPEYKFFYGYSVYILVAWNTSAISHFFSVTLSPSTALLIAVLVPAIYISMFGGIKPTYNDMNTAQKVIAYSGCGIYSIENLVMYQFEALPSYVMNIAPIQSTLSTYNYSEDHVTRNALILLAIGAVWRLLTLIAICVKVYGGKFSCACKGKKQALPQSDQTAGRVVNAAV